MSDNSKEPVAYTNCVRVYEAMKSEAVKGSVEGFEGLIYTGKLTHKFAELGFSVPYYTSIMNNLRAMVCVIQLRRGGGNAPSIWGLIEPPNMVAFEQIDKEVHLGTRQSLDKRLSQQIRDLARMVQDLHREVDALREEMEKRNG